MIILLGVLLTLSIAEKSHSAMDIVVNTWPFTKATDAAWCELKNSGSAMMAVERGCTEAEHDLSIGTVGYGGSPDEQNNVTLDALIMDGDSMQTGAVAAMPYVKDAIKVAHYVLKYTRHTLLVGEPAAVFAREMGFTWQDLSTVNSTKLWQTWRESQCQPNFRRNVDPDPSSHCGPYKPRMSSLIQQGNTGDHGRIPGSVDEHHHDTIGMVALNRNGSMAVGTSTNGAIHRVAGRVGDTAVVGAGGYADSAVGAAAGTGDGDLLMRFQLSYEAVRLMSEGMSPTAAATKALWRVKQKGSWSGALVVLNNRGEYGGACVGFTDYYISVRSHETGHSTITHKIDCFGRPEQCRDD